ncbi:hypothetical protein OH460_08695 [Vibrio sp. Makdt]|uniref:hypothetical protein n=1 Tax=Vibrio sp. Makdt TaxID=2998828 RepID=UPI0022CD2C06|nr:hypothetical protein [Vibrio sp. Makdt]MDA0152379.1 hypothetical protein [Vibrio sp. Makdt]
MDTLLLNDIVEDLSIGEFSRFRQLKQTEMLYVALLADKVELLEHEAYNRVDVSLVKSAFKFGYQMGIRDSESATILSEEDAWPEYLAEFVKHFGRELDHVGSSIGGQIDREMLTGAQTKVSRSDDNYYIPPSKPLNLK